MKTISETAARKIKEELEKIFDGNKAHITRDDNRAPIKVAIVVDEITEEDILNIDSQIVGIGIRPAYSIKRSGARISIRYSF